MKTSPYWLVSRLHWIDGFGLVRSYGIACNQQIVYDVSTYRSQVTAFIEKINRCELAPVHLKDCIYDFLCTL